MADQTLESPNFLGIGAPRAGSTWLWANLRAHPDLWLPPKKEIHYFDRSPRYASPSHLSEVYFWRRLLGREKPNQNFRRILLRSLGRNIRHPSWERMQYETRYLFGTYNDQWYASLFAQGKGKVTGDITPAYSILESADVESISRLLPHAKIIYVLRNPIERTWSAMRKGYNKTHEAVSELSSSDLEKRAVIPALNRRGDYVKTLLTWRAYFPTEQIFVGFYDDIVDRPRELLLDLFKFLEVGAAEKHLSHLATRRLNTSPPAGIPAELKSYLAKLYGEQIEQLAALVGGHAEQWLRDIEPY